VDPVAEGRRVSSARLLLLAAVAVGIFSGVFADAPAFKRPSAGGALAVLSRS
jgi:hypothetical protein